MSSRVQHWTGRLLAEAQFGHVIIIAGIVKPHPIKLSIDFSDQDTPTPSIHEHIVLHLSVRFNERQIVRSSHFPGVGWSDDQISDNLINKRLRNPLLPGQPFAVRLTILQAIFQVHVNDESYCTYDYSQFGGGALRNGGGEQIAKQIKVVRVLHDFERITRFDHRQLFPNVFPVQFDYGEWMADAGDVRYRHVFGSDVPEALTVGAGVELRGLVAGPRDAEYGVDLLGNDSQRVVFRLHCRFGERTVVRNAMRADMRFYEEDEERVGVFPFKRGHEFKIGLQVTRESYLIVINDEYYAYFNHRQPPNVAVVKAWASIGTDLTIFRIDFQPNAMLAASCVAKSTPCCSYDSEDSK